MPGSRSTTALRSTRLSTDESSRRNDVFRLSSIDAPGRSTRLSTDESSPRNDPSRHDSVDQPISRSIASRRPGPYHVEARGTPLHVEGSRRTHSHTRWDPPTQAELDFDLSRYNRERPSGMVAQMQGRQFRLDTRIPGAALANRARPYSRPFRPVEEVVVTISESDEEVTHESLRTGSVTSRRSQYTRSRASPQSEAVLTDSLFAERIGREASRMRGDSDQIAYNLMDVDVVQPPPVIATSPAHQQVELL